MDTTRWDNCTWLCPICEADRTPNEHPAFLELAKSGEEPWEYDGAELTDDDGNLIIDEWLRKQHTEPIAHCVKCETTFDVKFDAR